MDKRTWLIGVNSLLLVAVVLQGASSVWMAFFSAPEWLFDLHKVIGATFLTLLVVHLSLNFAWFKKNNPANLKKKKATAED